MNIMLIYVYVFIDVEIGSGLFYLLVFTICKGYASLPFNLYFKLFSSYKILQAIF